MATQRVLLRPLRKEESPLLYDGATDPEQVILSAPFRFISDADNEAWFESMLTKRTDLIVFTIVDLGTQQVLGICQLLNINWRHRSAELQVLIADIRYQEWGFGSEAVKLLTHFGFVELNLNRIYLHVSADNIQAIEVYEKCGFIKEALMKEAAFIDGSWVDVVSMAKLNKND